MKISLLIVRRLSFSVTTLKAADEPSRAGISRMGEDIYVCERIGARVYDAKRGRPIHPYPFVYIAQ
jgi:hypothetical protein